MEARCGGLFFTSKFDSGNLARVEKVERDDEDVVAPISVNGEPRPDYEFNVWTRPDCAETEFENPNRSWFYFGVKGYSPNRLMKINIQNLNKQGKLYGQGFAPFVRIVGARPGRWERIRDKATFEIIDNQFILSFTYRFPDQRGNMIQFSFCYPWSYEESNQKLTELDLKYEHCSDLTAGKDKESIYYHRELLCYSLSHLQVDLVTISDFHGITDKVEPRFDPRLFPDRDQPRCRRFNGKRVYVLTCRVHPGETPGSHVFNGFLDFILKENDPRAKVLRRNFVFKMIPILNPDGVIQGHYRTDTRGVNLNRVYLDPDPSLYPTIYAAKAVLVYYHVHYRVRRPQSESSGERKPGKVDHSGSDTNTSPPSESGDEAQTNPDNSSLAYEGSAKSDNIVRDITSIETLNRSECASANKREVTPESSQSDADHVLAPTPKETKTFKSRFSRFDVEFDGKLTYFPKRKSSQGEIGGRTPDAAKVTRHSEQQATAIHVKYDLPVHNDMPANEDESDDQFFDATDRLGNEGSDEEGDFTPGGSGDCKTPHLSDPKLLEIPPSRSGVAFYVDLHGHASKRGCFIYGNFLEHEEQMVDCLLYPKLISMNTAHFDFGGCNFSMKNMYTKDKRDGMTKEGSGRVAIYKAIGIVRSYTLECNYNMGRMVNCVPPASNDDGKASPPPLAGFPPKYTIAHYEEVGKACAIAALDVIEANPWSRIHTSEYYSLYGVREWVRRYYRSFKGSPAKGSRIVPRLPMHNRPANNTAPVNGSLSGPRLSLTEATATTSTSSLNGKRVPFRRDSTQGPAAFGRRESLPLANRNRPITQRRASDTEQSSRSPSKRTTPGTPPKKYERKSPVFLSLSKRDSTGSLDNAQKDAFRPSNYTERHNANDKRRALPSYDSRRIPPTPPATTMSVPPALVTEFSSLHSDDSTENPERYHRMKITVDENNMRLRQKTTTFGNPSTSAYQQQQFEEEEKKIQQLKDLCQGGVYEARPGNQVLLNKNLEPPKSDPLKRKAPKRAGGKRRSNSHSPKSAKGGRSWMSSGTDSNSEAEKRRPTKRRNLKVLKDRDDGRESKSGLQTVGITGVKLSPRPAVNAETTMLQMRQFLMADGGKEPEGLDSGLARLSLLTRRNSSPSKMENTAPRWIDP